MIIKHLCIHKTWEKGLTAQKQISQMNRILVFRQMSSGLACHAVFWLYTTVSEKPPQSSGMKTIFVSLPPVCLASLYIWKSLCFTYVYYTKLITTPY